MQSLIRGRPEIPIFPLEPRLVCGDETVEVEEQHPVEDRALRMARAVDSRHSHKADSKSVPGTAEGRSGGTRKNLSTIGDARGKKGREPSALFGLGHGADFGAVIGVNRQALS